MIRLLRGRVGADLTLIGVGGVTTVEDAMRAPRAGADLLQAYTGFVYEGPCWPRRVNPRSRSCRRADARAADADRA